MKKTIEVEEGVPLSEIGEIMSKETIEVNKDAVEKLDDLIWTCYAHWRAHNEERMPYDSYPDFLALITKHAKGVAKSFDLYPYNQPEVKEPNPIPKKIREEKYYEWLR